MIKAFVFDFDGVILDTERIMLDASVQVYKENNLEFPMQLYSTTFGTYAYFNPVEDLKEKLPELSQEEIESKIYTNIFALIAEADVMPGVRELLDFARAHGIKTAIGSSSPRAWIDQTAADKGILDKFDVFVNRDNVARIKPDPEIFITAMRELGVEPQETIVFEDSENGLKAAKAAGAYCVTVSGCMTEYFDLSASDLHLETLADLSPQEIIGEIDR